MYGTYRNIDAEELDQLINEITEANNRAKHDESWKIINHITGRKNRKKGIRKGDLKIDFLAGIDISATYLVWNESDIPDNSDDIIPIFHDLNIASGPFTLNEYQKAKNKISECKNVALGNEFCYEN